MTCACESIHPFPCQFPGETEFFRITPEDDREWCRFHLPLENENGAKSVKELDIEGWEREGTDWVKFTREIYARLRAATSWDDVRISDPRADLGGIAFPSFFNFTGIVDILHVKFERATFGNGVNFEGATFGPNAHFNGTTFGDTAYFNGAIFGRFATFADATFGNYVRFIGAKFGEWVNFNRATFGDRAYFENAAFGDQASFCGATFGSSARFVGTTFGNRISFAKATFQGESDFSAGAEAADLSKDKKEKTAKLNFKHVDFSNATFNGLCSFVNRDFATGADFNGAVFRDLVEFHGCTFHPGMSFHGTKFLKTREDELGTKKANDDATEALERSYRTLKRAMADLHARNEEADFFALEMECRRQRGSVPWFERLTATAYKHLSDYGRSVAKPLVWMGFLLGYGFVYFYHLAQAKSFRLPADVLRFVLEQITAPFSIWSGRYNTDPWVKCYLKEHPILLYAPATIMTLMAIALVTLFLLALRRRFKMD